MTRIIPWKLPEVKGGSIGGYTERGSGSGGGEEVLPVEYYGFSNVGLSYDWGQGSYKRITLKQPGNSSSTLSMTEHTITPSWSATQTIDITGIEIKDLIGVAQLVVLIKSQEVIANIQCDSEVELTLNPTMFNITGVVGGKVTLTRLSGSSNIYEVYLVDAYHDNMQSCSMTFFVYNGNGEIIQQSEEIVLK